MNLNKNKGILVLVAAFILYLYRSKREIDIDHPASMITERTIQVDGINIHYLEVNPTIQAGATVLLLHGQAFNAEHWRQAGTLDVLAEISNIRAVAVSLPGHGKSSAGPLEPSKRGAFLKSLIHNLQLTAPIVLITPSMSGSYALPYLLQHSGSKEVAAWLEVAAVQVRDWAEQQGELASDHPMRKLKVVGIYGDRDARRTDFDALETALPQAQFLLIPNAGHACYLDNSEVWNRELMTFLQNEIL